MKKLIRIVFMPLCFALAGCWQAATTVYDRNDFYLPSTAGIVSINDQYGPLGVYKINSSNQYVPLYTQAKGLGFEKDFRGANFGLVPLDRLLTVFGDKTKWPEKRRFSSQIFPDNKNLLMITVGTKDSGVGQALTVSYVAQNIWARCNGALYQNSPGYDTFMKNHADTNVAISWRKLSVAMAVTESITSAHKKGTLNCQEYRVAEHLRTALPALVSALKAGDRKRAIAQERAKEQRQIAAAREAELNAYENREVYNPDGYYIVSRGGVLRLKKGKDRSYRPSYNAYLEADNGGYPRPYLPGDLVGRAVLYRDTQQFNFSNYTFTSQRRCAEFTDPYWAGQMKPRAAGMWVLSDTFPSNRAYNGKACAAYSVRVNSCARVRCAGTIDSAPDNGTTYLVEGRKQAITLFQKLK